MLYRNTSLPYRCLIELLWGKVTIRKGLKPKPLYLIVLTYNITWKKMLLVKKCFYTHELITRDFARLF